jgi:hypothetical protein
MSVYQHTENLTSEVKAVKIVNHFEKINAASDLLAAAKNIGIAIYSAGLEWKIQNEMTDLYNAIKQYESELQ